MAVVVVAVVGLGPELPLAELVFLPLCKYIQKKIVNMIIINMEYNELRIIICLRKSEVTVERISVCNVTAKLMEHGICCQPFSYTYDTTDQLPSEL